MSDDPDYIKRLDKTHIRVGERPVPTSFPNEQAAIEWFRQENERIENALMAMITEYMEAHKRFGAWGLRWRATLVLQRSSRVTLCTN